MEYFHFLLSFKASKLRIELCGEEKNSLTVE